VTCLVLGVEGVGWVVLAVLRWWHLSLKKRRRMRSLYQ
jgi:hypothetical protein